jgi:signal transduction histidine kinase
MIKLVPDWAQDYPEFWNTIRRRNIWFIKIRYFAVFSLVAFLFLGQYVLDFKLSDTQVIAFLSVACSILIYNIIIHFIRPNIGITPGKFNALHLSFVQMILDLITLMLLVYFTGTKESPLYVFFIFHMVIGSIILPVYIVRIICISVILIYSFLIYLQNTEVITTHIISGLMVTHHHTWNYDVLFLIIFSSLMIITVLLTNRIARNLLRREEELRRSLLQLDEMEKSKQRYLMGVVHEIKSPISAIKSITDILLQRFLGPIEKPIEEKISRIQSRSDQALHLINSILNISKLKLLEKTEDTKIYPGELINDYLEEHSDSLNKKNINVEVIDTRKMRKPISGDETLIKLAFSNIISNAKKYVLENGIVRIKIDYDNEFVRIKVADNGIGIPEDDLHKIFNQFYRASNTRKFDAEGTGLGLSIVKEIINHHNGTIEAVSPSEIGDKDNPGTEFIIKLPYILEDSTEPLLQPLAGGL